MQWVDSAGQQWHVIFVCVSLHIHMTKVSISQNTLVFAMPNITPVVRQQQQQLQQPPPQQLPYMQQPQAQQQLQQQPQQQPQQHQAYPPLPVGSQPPQTMYGAAPTEYNPAGQQRWT